MKYGIREICDVVFKAKNTMTVGNRVFYKNEPVIYFDTLKTSSLEAASDTVYAQGGKGNPRLIAWDGNRTLTFNMQDALISSEGFMILSGAGLVEATDQASIKQHITETVDASNVSIDESTEDVTITLSNVAYLPTDQGENFAYVMFVKNGEIVSEPYIPTHVASNSVKTIVIPKDGHEDYVLGSGTYVPTNLTEFKDATNFDSVIVDYYTEKKSGAQQMEITADKFGGNFYVEASTLFRNTDGKDMPAEFVIPNAKVQSNFTFSMAADGDPSAFDFVMDAFPDYTRFDKSKKVLAAVQIITEESGADSHRTKTEHATA